MPYHDQIEFEGLHKAKFMGGLEADLPATPEGFGDAYWAVDTLKLFLSNEDGTAWVEFVPGGGAGAIALDDLSDVDVSTAAAGYALLFNGTTTWNAQNVARVFGTGTVLFDPTSLADGKIYVYNASLSRFVVADRVVNISDLGDVDSFTQAKGDIIVNSGSAFTKLAAGTNGKHLVANSATATGLEWQTPFTADMILTNDGEILVDDNGNVLTI